MLQCWCGGNLWCDVIVCDVIVFCNKVCEMLYAYVVALEIIVASLCNIFIL